MLYPQKLPQNFKGDILDVVRSLFHQQVGHLLSYKRWKLSHSTNKHMFDTVQHRNVAVNIKIIQLSILINFIAKPRR